MVRTRVLALLLVAACDDFTRDGADAGFFAGRDASVVDSGSADVGALGDDSIMVGWVVDGDTVRLRAGARVRTPDGRPMDGESIRMLGVDAPEIAHPPAEPSPECWGNESHAAARELMQGRFVRLEYDDPNDVRDPYNRLLAYVILVEDDRVANEVQIRTGQACSYSRFSHRDRAKYEQLESDAHDEGLGIWACSRACR